VVLSIGPLTLAYAQDAQPAQSPATTTSQGTISLGTAKYHYTRAPRPFPNLFAPFKPIAIESPGLTNSPKLDQMIQDGKIPLSLQDAVELALQNNLDIVVQRYNPWLADTSILKASAGGFGGGTPGGAFAGSTAAIPSLSFDPLITTTFSIDGTIRALRLPHPPTCSIPRCSLLFSWDSSSNC
jgi:opacity protein-like surface antigen